MMKATFVNVDLGEADMRGVKIGRHPSLKGHEGPVFTIETFSDGDRIISGS